jgi:hypothetical protein
LNKHGRWEEIARLREQVGNQPKIADDAIMVPTSPASVADESVVVDNADGREVTVRVLLICYHLMNYSLFLLGCRSIQIIRRWIPRQ